MPMDYLKKQASGGGVAWMASTAIPRMPKPVFAPPGEGAGGGQEAPAKDLKEIGELSVKLLAAADEVKKLGETTQAEIKNLGKVSGETKEAADKALVMHGELSKRMTDLEQKMVRAAAGPERQKTLGDIVVNSDEVKALLQSKSGKARVNVKAIISALTTDADGSVGDAIAPVRLPGIITAPERRMTVRDLLTPGRTSSPSIQYVKETGFTNLAATVSETSAPTKPQSEIKFDIVNTAVTTIAHWVLATKQILDDVPQLQSYIDGRLRYGLAYAEELQLLLGSGGGTDLNGIYTQATAYSAPITVVDETDLDTIRLAMLQAFLAEYPPTGIVLNPKDWARIELLKDDLGRYIIGVPQGVANRTLWGLPVVETQALTQDKFLVGAFKLGAQIFDREDANVLISTEDSDNFRKNLVTILAEERLGLAVYRPQAFIKGDLGNVSP